MFENLKAFIRHGKQANDLKKKPVVYSDFEANQEEFVSEGSSSINNEFSEPIGPKAGGSDATIFTRDVSMSDFHGNDTKYQQAASHIVEQENIQRQKIVKYENLENYEVLEKMGEGAFSIVYKARHLPSNTLVAIKILRKFQMDQAQKQSVLKEVTIMRQLDHPNIVKFIEFIDSESYYYIVQELAIGGEIFTAIVNYTYFSEELSRHVITQVAEAIRYLHEEVGIVHRDIKPENLLYLPIEFQPSANPVAKLRRSDDYNSKKDEGEFIPGVGGGTIGVVKLADFGLSKQVWEQNTKTPCGTVGYTAPEIVRDERYSKEVDMWALGCVLYTLLCGFPPFYDERIETLTEKVARGEYTFLSPWWDEISPEAKYCVSKLLTVDPSKRYTIDDLLSDPWMMNTFQMKNESIAKSKNANYTLQNSKYSKKYKSNSELYSPALSAMRDAFDISTAVHRMGEEAALSSKLHGRNFGSLVEEEEEDDEVVDLKGCVIEDSATRHAPRHQKQANQIPSNNVFDLSLNGASILERRKNKAIPI